jgi:hypothetical protein
MGIVIPPRVDPNTGQTIHTTEDNYNDLVARYSANQAFQNSFNQPIPGLTGQYGGYGGIPLPGQPTPGGLLAQVPQPAPQPQQRQQSAFMPNGMYGRQAMQLAGTYSPNTPPGDTYPNGLLGGKGGAFRPGGK